MKKKRKVFLLPILFVLAVVLIMLYSNLAISVSRYDKQSQKIPSAFDGFKLMLLSDLHNKEFGTNNARLIDVIKNENPDILVLSGDMINSKSYDFSVFYNFAEQVAPLFDTYFVYGNHEERFDEATLIKFDARLEEYGIKILNNTNTTITRGDSSITLYGLRLPLYFYTASDADNNAAYELTADEINEFIGIPNSESFNILLTHNPLYFEAYASWGADLTLSGHIHGGVVRIPFLGGLFSPDKSLLPKYDAGEYIIGTSTLILSRGLGEHIAPLRFLNPADVCIIELFS